MSRSICLRIAAALLLLSPNLGGQAAPPPNSASPTFLRTGKFWDAEKGIFVQNRVLKVVGDTIAEVAEHLPIPDGAKVIDLTKATVLPGLIDAHTHLLASQVLTKSSQANMALDFVAPLIFEGDALRALHAAARARTFLEAGITTVQDLGNCGHFGDVALKSAIDDGSVAGPRMRVSGPGLSPVGGQFPGVLPQFQPLVDAEYRVVRGVEDAVQAVRSHVLMGVSVIKVYSDSAPNRARLSVEEMSAITREAHRYGLRVTAHCVFDCSVRDAVLAGVDGIDHLYDASDETLKLIKDKGTMVVPTYTDSVSYIDSALALGDNRETAGKEWEGLRKKQASILGKCMALGIPIASGSDSYVDLGIPQGQAAKRVLYAYAECGMPVKEILRAVTVHAATHLGLAGRIGVLKPEALADIVAVEGDPEVDIHCLDKVVFVMKGGKVFVGDKP